MSNPHFYSEKKLADRLNLPREKLRAIRNDGLALEEPAHFATVKREIAYTPAGLGRLLDYLRATDGGEIPADLEEFSLLVDDEKNGSPEEQDDTGIETLKILRVFPNRHLLSCTRSNSETVRVWVPDNRKFVPKMELQARPRANSTLGYYEIVGRCPRRKGRY